MFMDDSCLFPFSIFFEEKQNKNTSFFSFLKEKQIVCEEQLHFIRKIIKFSILHFLQGNELNQSIIDHEINKIEFVNCHITFT